MKKIILTFMMFLSLFLGVCFGFTSNAAVVNPPSTSNNLLSKYDVERLSGSVDYSTYGRLSMSSKSSCKIKFDGLNSNTKYYLYYYSSYISSVTFSSGNSGNVSFESNKNFDNNTLISGNGSVIVDHSRAMYILSFKGTDSLVISVDTGTFIMSMFQITINSNKDYFYPNNYGYNYGYDKGYNLGYDRGFVNGFNPNYVAPFELPGWTLVIYVYDSIGDPPSDIESIAYTVSDYSNGWTLDLLKLTTDIYNDYHPVYIDILLVNEYGLDTKQLPLFFKANAPYTYTYTTTLKPQEWITPYYSSAEDSSARYVYEIEDIGDSFLSAVKINTLRQDSNGQVISIFNSGTQLLSLGFDISMFDTGYNRGFNEGLTAGKEQGYNNGFETGKEQGYNNGYNSGYSKGYTEGSGSDNTFVGMIFAIADIPIHIISSIFGFELFGINLFVALCSILSLLMVIWVIRKFL